MDSERSKTPKVEDAETARTDGQTESAEPVRAAEKGRTFRGLVPSVRSGSLIMILTAVMDLTQGHLTSNP